MTDLPLSGDPLLIAAVCAFLSVAMMVAWLAQRITGNGGWVDVIWTFITGGAGVAFAVLPPDGVVTPRGWLIAALAALWSLRLGIHLARRSAAQEDARYAWFRKEWGKDFHRRMFVFLQVQAAAAAILAAAMWLAARNPAPGLGVMDAVGVAVFLIALWGETTADAQLDAFKAVPANKGKVCDRGLWAWSRHPNYFFEWLVWLGFALCAVNLSGDWPWGWLAFLAPLFMLYLLTRKSGLPPLEDHMARSRPEAWADYKARTSVFFPLPPKASPRKRADR
jgi:steroid 5-alpha reductase family enzyme